MGSLTSSLRNGLNLRLQKIKSTFKFFIACKKFNSCFFSFVKLAKNQSHVLGFLSLGKLEVCFLSFRTSLKNPHILTPKAMLYILGMIKSSLRV
eukprot:UN06402